MGNPGRQPLSQHFLWNRRLVDRLVRASSLSPDDLVLEIGPGRGILTEALLRVAARVVAVELDGRLCRALRERWGQRPQLALVEGDFLEYPLPQEPYKVFASLPYSRTCEMLRKLLHAEPAPRDCYLVVQREAAEKYTVHARANSMAALLHYPWWDTRVTHQFERGDFSPAPSVDSVLLRLTLRTAPLLDAREKAGYRDYVTRRFEHDRGAKDMPPATWLRAYEGFARGAAPRQRAAVRGAYARLMAQQAKLKKIHRTRSDRGWRRFGREGK